MVTALLESIDTLLKIVNGRTSLDWTLLGMLEEETGSS